LLLHGQQLGVLGYCLLELAQALRDVGFDLV
jgi:hypothetical protein